MKKLMVLGLVTLSLALSNCAYKKVKYDGEQGNATNATDASAPGLKADVAWVKNKKDTLDVLVNLRNEYDTPIFIKSNSFNLEYEGSKAVANSENAVAVIQPGQTVEQVLIFKIGKGKAREGTANITVDPIYKGTVEAPQGKVAALKLSLPVAKK